jgi:hypothetical protein
VAARVKWFRGSPFIRAVRHRLEGGAASRVRRSVSQTERGPLVSVYEWVARLLGTQPIRVRIATDAFTFHCGNSVCHVRPVVWCSDTGSAGKVLALGDEPPPPGALPVNLTSGQALHLPTKLRGEALKAVLARGFRGLGGEGTFQRPEVIFENDAVLTDAFGGQQRDALRQAASSAGAFGSRFGRRQGEGSTDAG